MAQIFLSYAHEDLGTAKLLAKALERTGHSVWWDRHVGGGARFAAEIARALKDAEVVIAVWSQASVQSTWVQDEAAEGRDSGRLAPVSIDASQPPLGFRQFQSVDLSGWRGRRSSAAFKSLEQAIDAVLKGERLPEAPARVRKVGWRGWPARAAAAVLALLLIAAAVLYGTGGFAPQTNAASLAVLPFSDLSPTRDKAYFADGVAEEIRTLLSSVPGVQVVGRTSIDMLGPGAGLKQAREQLGVTHMLEGSMRVQGQKMRLNVRLLRTADGLQIWAEQFDRDLKDIFEVQAEVGSAVAERLRWRLWRFPLGERTARTSVQVYDLVLAARFKMGRGDYESSLESHRLAEQATRIDPKYSPAWVELSRSIYAIDGSRPEGWAGPQWPARRERALRYARHAVALDPKNADAQAFLAWVESAGERPDLALPRIRKAMALNPGESSVWGIAGIIYGQMCDYRGRLEVWRRYAALEPLDSWSNMDLVFDLYALGHDAEADALKRKLSQDPKIAEEIALRLSIQKGDFSSVLATLLKRNADAPSFNAAYALRTLGTIDRAVALLPGDHHKSVGAFWQHDYSRAAAEAEWLRHGNWSTARGFVLTRSMVYAGRHRDLLRLFYQRFGSVEELDRRTRCDLPSIAAPLVTAHRTEGRNGEAERLIRLADRRMRQGRAERHYDFDEDVGYIELLVVAGRRNAALAALEQAIRRQGLRGGGPPVMRLDLADPVFDPIRNHPRFKAVERRVAEWRAKELRELAAAGVRV